MLSPIKDQDHNFWKKLFSLDWSWVSTSTASDALQHYFAILYLLWKHRVGLVPNKQADMLLHQHMQNSRFDDEMRYLFGTELIHVAGASQPTTVKLTQKLLAAELQTVTEWEPADCGIFLAA